MPKVDTNLRVDKLMNCDVAKFINKLRIAFKQKLMNLFRSICITQYVDNVISMISENQSIK